MPCIGTEHDPCGRLFHFTSNAAKRCPACRIVRERELDTKSKRRRRRAAASKRDASPAPAVASDVADEIRAASTGDASRPAAHDVQLELGAVA